MQAIELEAHITESHEIHLKLPDSITASMARVIVMYDNTPITTKKRIFGQYRHAIKIADDFDEELPSTFWLGETS